MYYGLITVRSNSNRFPKKCFQKLNNISVIDHCILRAKFAGIIPIICTTSNKKDNIFKNYAKKHKVKIFRGSEQNKIKRWYDCIKHFRIKKFHTIDADDPYFDYFAIKKSIRCINKTYNIILPSQASRKGGASEGYSFSYFGIEALYQSLFNYNFKNFDKFDTEMIDNFIKNLNLKKKKFGGTSYEIKSNIRLTLDYEEDYKLLRVLSNIFNYSSSRYKINRYLSKNRYLLDINFFLNKKWKSKQNSFKTPKIFK